MKDRRLKLLVLIASITVDIFWIFEHSKLLYLYHFTDVLFNIMYPDWTLVVNIVFALIGLVLITYWISKKALTKAVMINFILLFVGQMSIWLSMIGTN